MVRKGFDKVRDLLKPSLREEERIKRNLQKIQSSKRSMGNNQSCGTLPIIPISHANRKPHCQSHNLTHQNSFYCYIKPASRSQVWYLSWIVVSSWLLIYHHFLHQWLEAISASVFVCFDRGCVVPWCCVLNMWRHRLTKQRPNTKVTKATTSAEMDIGDEFSLLRGL